VVKFWKEDFRYIARHYCFDDYFYTFSIRGESANYLMNKYHLDYPIIQVNVFMNNGSMSITSRAKNGLGFCGAEIKEDDYKELMDILQKEIDNDLRNYEEWQCNSDYYKKDSR